MEAGALSANWKKLQTTLKPTNPAKPSSQAVPSHGVKRKRAPLQLESRRQSPRQTQIPRKRPRMENSMVPNGASKSPATLQDLEASENAPPLRPVPAAADLVNAGLSPTVEVGRYVAIDCEMVGVGPNPDRESALARVSLVNYNGEQVYDSYVLPKESVTDWRTHVSGIAPHHMKVARSLEEVLADISRLVKDRVLIGHAIRNDLEALMLVHPKKDIRDTARHAPYRKLAGGSSPRLKILASELLGFEIQDGAHSSVEDARACILLFRRDKAAFEREHAKKWPSRAPTKSTEAEGTSLTEKARKKKKRKKR
ncbi:uncharacterized protein A1O9_12241 [Exophiala aquamarina CBS 119918]|uniref:RNA exonuclease 4 n=1 Tax=Exophiala aquamarina CBS 119918 TaxID=1182545 RepID=A0A072NVG5_9EURO|nr:uncharacterized protein A1O9_12241 [Exophiala aquamarina CBS 119918]KEF51606.1 hypothetical protein A1O9_12241 [Exophiala aquamarina CBS 119918]